MNAIPARQQRRAPQKPVIIKKRWLPWLILGGSVMLGFTLLLALFVVIGVLYLSQERIAAGVSVAGVDLSGKTPETAERLLRDTFGNPAVTLNDGARQWTLRLSNLGVTLDVDASLQAAEQAAGAVTLLPAYRIDLEQAQIALVELSAQVNIAAVPGQPGRAMEIPVTLDRLRVDVSGELADGLLELDMIETEPPVETPGGLYNGDVTTHTIERGQELALIARLYNVSMDEIVRLNALDDPDLLYVGQELIIPAAGVYEPSAADAPPAPTSTGKAILVSTGEQRIYAYENGALVYSRIVSTGRSETPTVKGDYSIYVKYAADDMAGPGYFLPQVPYTMYFYQGYAIHGTYWHNSFGRPMSHGCVNLPVGEAQWFFNWAEVGTLVRVI
jgi:LysM repeat protein